MNISELSGQSVNNVDSQQSNVEQSQESSKAARKQLQDKENAVEKRNEKKAEELSEKEFKEVTEKLNETVQTFHEDLQFQLHEESDMMMAKLVNIQKHETIKEMPPKEMLDMLGKIKKMVGLIIDEKI